MFFYLPATELKMSLASPTSNWATTRLSVNFIKAAREAAAMISSATLQIELNRAAGAGCAAG